MKIAFIPKASYSIGQVITVNGQKLRVESYSHTGKNLIATTLHGAIKFKRVVCVLTNDLPICEVANHVHN